MSASNRFNLLSEPEEEEEKKEVSIEKSKAWNSITSEIKVFETPVKKQKEEINQTINYYEDSDEEGEDLTEFWKARNRAREIYENLKSYSTKGFLDELTFDDVFHFLYPEWAVEEEF
jgi:hypothetical protein